MSETNKQATIDHVQPCYLGMEVYSLATVVDVKANTRTNRVTVPILARPSEPTSHLFQTPTTSRLKKGRTSEPL